jgi:hypothetical protein
MIESIPLFSENNLPTNEILFINSEFAISFNKGILDKTHIAIRDFEFPK